MRIHTSVGFLFKLKRKTPGIPRSGYGFKKTQGSAQNLCKNHTRNTFFPTLGTPDFILLRKRKLGALRAPPYCRGWQMARKDTTQAQRKG